MKFVGGEWDGFACLGLQDRKCERVEMGRVPGHQTIFALLMAECFARVNASGVAGG
jgi:hypothetical protein